MTNLCVHLYSGAVQFLTAAEPLLRSDPFSTNVIAVVAARIAAGDEPDSEHHLWATIGDGEGHIVGAAMHTPPHHLLVSPMPVAICPASTAPSKQPDRSPR